MKFTFPKKIDPSKTVELSLDDSQMTSFVTGIISNITSGIIAFNEKYPQIIEFKNERPLLAMIALNQLLIDPSTCNDVLLRTKVEEVFFPEAMKKYLSQRSDDFSKEYQGLSEKFHKQLKEVFTIINDPSSLFEKESDGISHLGLRELTKQIERLAKIAGAEITDEGSGKTAKSYVEKKAERCFIAVASQEGLKVSLEYSNEKETKRLELDEKKVEELKKLKEELATKKVKSQSQKRAIKKLSKKPNLELQIGGESISIPSTKGVSNHSAMPLDGSNKRLRS
jgi:hypothetical protein